VSTEPLRLVVFSDLHIDLVAGPTRQRIVLAELAAGLDALDPDIVLYAGDLANSLEPVRRSLLPLARGRLANLFVPGNHDAYLSDTERANLDDSDGHLLRFRGLVQAAGWHWLPGAPLLLGSFGFAGAMGWYDYSFADPALGAGEMAYRRGRFGSAIWNDMNYARFRRPDEEVAARDLAALSADLDMLGVTPEGGPPTVVTTHHLPYRELLIHRFYDRGWEFCNAFMGTRALGELFDTRPSIRLAVAGHTHTPRELERPDGFRVLISPLGYEGSEEWPAHLADRLVLLLLHPNGRIERVGEPYSMSGR